MREASAQASILSRLPGVDYLQIALIIVVALAVVSIGSGAGRSRDELLRKRLAVIDRKLDAILDHLDVEVPQPYLQQVEDLVREDQPIKAVKAYRDATGASLLEAKEAVDRIAGRAGRDQ